MITVVESTHLCICLHTHVCVCLSVCMYVCVMPNPVHLSKIGPV